MSLLRSNREVRMSVASCNVHVHLSGTLQNTSLGNSCGTATPFFYPTETGQRKVSLISPSVIVVIRCYMCNKILNLEMKGQEPQFSIREGHDKYATDVKHS